MMLDLLPFRRVADRLERDAEELRTFRTRSRGKTTGYVRRIMTSAAALATRPALARKAAATLLAGVLAATPTVTFAQQQSIPVVRDAEIEALVRDYAKPILQAAGLTKSNINIILVNDRHFNAFVDGRRIFINTGALATADSPNEIIGVLAHEAGHLAGGHQHRLRDQLARAQTMLIVASLLGVGAMAAGVATDNKGLAKAGPGMMAGGAELAKRGLLSYQRSEEVAADRSAVEYLDATGQSARGMLKTFNRFQSALSLSGTRVDPYQISHPMPRERIANLQTLAEASRNFDAVDPPALQLRHDLMRAKIAAFSGNAATTSRLWKKDPTSLAAAYGDAISTYLHGNLKSALRKTDALIKEMPKNPYFHELRGDILLRGNKPKEAAAAYAKAVSLDPVKSGLLQVSYGQALLAAGDQASLEKAVGVLKTGLSRDKENVAGYRFLAQALGGLGDIPEANLATAEGYFYGGVYKDAKIFAARAQQQLKRGSPGWVRAQDIINFKIPGKNK
jgi:predicted Zn-dependent protease